MQDRIETERLILRGVRRRCSVLVVRLLCVSREQILEWIRKGQKVGKGETG